MRKTLINSIAIFISILGSFGVERYIQSVNDLKSKELLILNIQDEIKQNYYSLLETRASLKSVVDVTDSIINNWSSINSKLVKEFYFENQYALRDDMKTILSFRPYYSPKNLYFNSMIYSGLILKIKNKKLRENLESVYGTIESGQSAGGNNNQKIKSWFDELIEKEEVLDQEFIFNKYKNFKLFKLLNERRRSQVGFLYILEINIKSFEILIKEMENPVKFFK
tara:strand:- start:7116 stop:7787 length:672 start_codon:yes stop_codon:yes gene_type:complete